MQEQGHSAPTLLTVATAVPLNASMLVRECVLKRFADFRS